MNVKKKYVNEYHQLPILDGLELLNAKAHTLDFPFHTHETFNIALILGATFNTKLNDKFLKAPRGTLSITNPHEVHATPCDADLGASFFTFYVSPDALQDFNDGRSVFFEDKIIYDERIFSELYYLSLNFQHRNVDFANRLGAVLKILVTKYAMVKPLTYKSTRLFQSFINEIDDASFSLDRIAKQFGLNKYKFIRLFKQETGLTPNSFVLLKRIEASKEMLKNGKPIFNVALDSGFYDTSHFYKNFKRFTGVNPLDFQNALLVR